MVIAELDKMKANLETTRQRIDNMLSEFLLIVHKMTLMRMLLYAIEQFKVAQRYIYGKFGRQFMDFVTKTGKEKQENFESFLKHFSERFLEVVGVVEDEDAGTKTTTFRIRRSLMKHMVMAKLPIENTKRVCQDAGPFSFSF